MRRHPRPGTVGFVYMARVIAGPKKGHIKIGFTQFPDKRLREVAHDVRAPLELVWARRACASIEARMHEHFDRYTIGNVPGREWFNLSAAQVMRFRCRSSDLERCVIVTRPRTRHSKPVTAQGNPVETAQVQNAQVSAERPSRLRGSAVPVHVNACTSGRAVGDPERSLR